MEEYTTVEIEKILPIKRQRMREWIDRGFITPSIQRASGTGTKNLFSRWDLYGIYIFLHILNCQETRKMAKELYKWWVENIGKEPLDFRHKLSGIIRVYGYGFDKSLFVNFFSYKSDKQNSLNTFEQDLQNNPHIAKWDFFEVKRLIEEVDGRIRRWEE